MPLLCGVFVFSMCFIFAVSGAAPPIWNRTSRCQVQRPREVPQCFKEKSIYRMSTWGLPYPCQNSSVICPLGQDNGLSPIILLIQLPVPCS